MPESVLRQPDGRLLVAATVEDPSPSGSPGGPRRLVLVRLRPDGSLDQSFGQGGFAELDLDARYSGRWARLADGRVAILVSRPEFLGEPTFRTAMVWRLYAFTAEGSSTGPLRPTRTTLVGLDLLARLVDLVPTRDGGLLMIGVTAVRRIRPDGSLDATYGRGCAHPPRRAGSRGAVIQGGAATRDGGVLVTAAKLLIHARPRRVDSWMIPRDRRGCGTATPVRIRGLTAGPPLPLPGRSAVMAASYYTLPDFDTGLALIKVRR